MSLWDVLHCLLIQRVERAHNDPVACIGDRPGVPLQSLEGALLNRDLWHRFTLNTSQKQEIPVEGIESDQGFKRK